MKYTEKARRVVITGLGTINPIGATVEEYWNNLQAGTSGARIMLHSNMKDYHVKVGCEVDIPEDAVKYFSSKKVFRRMDRAFQFAQIAGKQAIDDSGLDVTGDTDRYGSVIGNGGGGLIAHDETITRIVTRGTFSVSPFYVTNAISNTTSAIISMEQNLKGPSFSITSACASANHALGVSMSLIQSGMADVMVTGGAEAVMNPPGIVAFGNIMAMSTRNDDPKTASRPFDKDRNGFVMGEGAGILVLEELEHALARGAKIYGEISGFGSSSDAYDLVAPHPEGLGSAKAMTLALEQAGLQPEDIGLINCHGTSTPVGDLAEANAIFRAFGPEVASSVWSHSTKSMTGHLIGAAGGVEAIAGLMAFEQNKIHPSINVFEQDENIKLKIATEVEDGSSVDHFISNGFGFGGHNSSVIISRYKG